jgi:hypothetical protein
LPPSQGQFEPVAALEVERHRGLREADLLPDVAYRNARQIFPK